MPRFDIAVIGAGTAGLTAAVAAARRGLSVCVFERKSAPLAQPGETLHPGCGVIFEQLGITRAVDGAATARHLGIHVTDDDGARYEPYGENTRGPWRGYQLPRDCLHRILLARAQDLGAEIRMGAFVRSLDRDGGEEMRLDTLDGPVTCRWLLDGTGPQGMEFQKRSDGIYRGIAAPNGALRLCTN
ncbi:MAG: FAD-dependent oxidoreductase [Pseudomonadota bacterium]